MAPMGRSKPRMGKLQMRDTASVRPVYEAMAGCGWLANQALQRTFASQLEPLHNTLA
jgi:hypothetical protein